MSVQQDQIVVVDIEATCWENNIRPLGQVSEIIEIGVCLLHTETFDISQKRSIFVQPVISEISPFCTQLTTITPELITEQALPLVAACQILEEAYGSRERLWGSWGMYDRTMFETQCARMDVRYPFSKHHVNIKSLFAKYVNDHERVGMAQALQKIGLELIGTHHRGDDDAYNIARILAHTLRQHTIKVLGRYW
ncbi:MAG: exonuclease domain-containing protein [Anaerolineae bacterium]|jgi:inhibitor of KinA sporulation pathway (predicted exonuclease)|nr:exonuclease domain-containing protein [Anaerolineae bacterium]